MPADGRFGGHIVTGHIDGIGTVSSIRKDALATWYSVKTTPQIMRYIIEKGSVAIDGISLTVAKVARDGFSVSVIPHTARETTLPEKTVGSVVNLESDILIRRSEFGIRNSRITKEFLGENGFL
jgi:riboflavin synthase